MKAREQYYTKKYELSYNIRKILELGITFEAIIKQLAENYPGCGLSSSI